MPHEQQVASGIFEHIEPHRPLIDSHRAHQNGILPARRGNRLQVQSKTTNCLWLQIAFERK